MHHLQTQNIIHLQTIAFQAQNTKWNTHIETMCHNGDYIKTQKTCVFWIFKSLLVICKHNFIFYPKHKIFWISSKLKHI